MPTQKSKVLEKKSRESHHTWRQSTFSHLWDLEDVGACAGRKTPSFRLKTSGKIVKNWQINQPSSCHLKKSQSVSTSTASPLFIDKIDKNVFRRLLRKRAFKVTDALVHRPAAVIDTSRHAKSQIGSASSHRDTAGSSLHKFTGCTGSGHSSRRTRLPIAREPRRRPHRMPNIRSIALNPTEIRPLELGTERSRTHV